MARNRIGAAAVALLVAFGLAAGGSAWAHDDGQPTGSTFSEADALDYSGSALGRRLGDYRFLDRDGRPLQLRDLRGRPLVISLIYTSCAHTSPILTQTLDRVVEVARDALGEDGFTVATIGFDTKVDTPARMRAYARDQGVDRSDWLFLSADAKTIDELSHDLGFVFFRSPKGFDHIAQTTLVDGQGRVFSQIYGQSFEPPALVEPLKRLALGGSAELGSVSNLIERVRLFCTVYDAASARYRFDYSIFIALAVGAASLSAVGVFLARAWLRSGPAKPAA
jgi:protein SCO1/2